MLDDKLPLTTIEYEEWGNPNEKKAFEYMLSYSPYDNVKSQDYPHMLFTAGVNDTRVEGIGSVRKWWPSCDKPKQITICYY
jgi:oligopeptidase B